MDRRQRIANAGIALIARGGTHRLTHRAVDAEAGLPNGSTSYYARSRRDLIRLVMEQLSAESQADLTDIEVPEKLTVQQAIELVGRLTKRLILNGDAQAARFALMFEVAARPRRDRSGGDRPRVRRSGRCGLDVPGRGGRSHRSGRRGRDLFDRSSGQAKTDGNPMT